MKKIVKRWTPARIMAAIAAGILPLVGIILGLCSGEIVTVPFLVTFVLIPCGTFVGVFFLIRSNLRVLEKTIACIFLLAAYVFVMFWMILITPAWYKETWTGQEGADSYQSAADCCSAFPEVSQLGPYKNLEYHEIESWMLIYIRPKCNLLICSYSQEDYQQHIQKVEESYVFQKEPLTEDGYVCPPSVLIDGYEFSMIAYAQEQYPDLDFPKRMFFILKNDNTCEIGYLYFEDNDLDYITSLESFILEDCGWKFVR